jgi:hypothetical protein
LAHHVSIDAGIFQVDSFNGHIGIWFETFVYQQFCISELFIPFIALLSFLSSNHSRELSGTSEASRRRPPERRSGLRGADSVEDDTVNGGRTGKQPHFFSVVCCDLHY